MKMQAKTMGKTWVAKQSAHEKLPREEEIVCWELAKGKRPFNGIGNLFRQYSQYSPMKRWEAKYDFKTALEVPFDHATDGIDGNVFSMPHSVVLDADEVSDGDAVRYMQKMDATSHDFVWNFGFLQREPLLIVEMVRISRKYVAAFTPNYTNPGTIAHKLYHSLYGNVCVHPERGDKTLMCVEGLKSLFKNAGLKILDAGYVDIPPFPDTVVTVKEFFFGSTSRNVLKIPVNIRGLLPFERIGYPRRIVAHHCYVLGVKQN
jgi:hypothetical protein